VTTVATPATPATTVDRHVVIISVDGSFTAAGERLTGPVTCVDKLEKLIDWAHGALCCSPSRALADPVVATMRPPRRGCGWWARPAGNWSQCPISRTPPSAPLTSRSGWAGRWRRWLAMAGNCAARRIDGSCWRVDAHRGESVSKS